MERYLVEAQLVGIPALLGSPLVASISARWIAWACWLLLAALALYFLYVAGFGNAGSIHHKIGSQCGWVAITAATLWLTRPLWSAAAPKSTLLRLCACIVLLIIPFFNLPLLPPID